MKKTYLIATLLLIILSSCKTKQIISKSTEKTVVLSAKNIIHNYEANKFNQKTISARLKAKYKSDKITTSIIIKLRLEKDKTIWMSATKLGIPIAKIIITPFKVRYYEKINKVYFEGSLASLTKDIGKKLDFKELQNVLLGQAVLNLKRGKYISRVVDNKYQLSSKKNKDFYTILFLLNPDNFKLNKQEIRNLGKDQKAAITYPSYNNIGGEQFPSAINIMANDGQKKFSLFMNYSQVVFNKSLRFPFKIPKGYKKIKLP
jgi:hypothetical protein